MWKTHQNQNTKSVRNQKKNHLHFYDKQNQIQNHIKVRSRHLHRAGSVFFVFYAILYVSKTTATPWSFMHQSMRYNYFYEFIKFMRFDFSATFPRCISIQYLMRIILIKTAIFNLRQTLECQRDWLVDFSLVPISTFSYNII